MELSQGQIIQKPNKQELSSFFTTHRFNVMHAPVKFHKYIPYDLGVMTWTQIGMDVRMGQMDRGNILIVLGFNDTSTLEGHFVSSPRRRGKRDRRESRGDEREGQGRKRNRNESEETEEIKTFPLYPYPLQG